jgi:hypothetical protein
MSSANLVAVLDHPYLLSFLIFLSHACDARQ